MVLTFCFLEGEVILCGVSFVCGLSVTICLLVIFSLFLGVADDFVGELLRVLLFMFPPDSLLGVSSRVPEPVDVVCTEGSLEALRRDGCGPIQNAGVWQSTETVFVVDMAMLVRIALAYEEGAGVGEGDDSLTSRLASPYVSFFSAFTRWISFSRIQTGHVFDDE